MSEFLNPKSMVTPGVAGALMMFIVNGLASAFPDLPPRIVALVLSFVLGALVVLKVSSIKVPERIGYWVINSLVIFVVGFGANKLGQEATGASQGIATVTAPFSTLVQSAYAQGSSTGSPPRTEAQKEPASTGAAEPSDDETKRLKAELVALRAENARLKKATTQAAPAKEPSRSFFKKW